MKELEVKYDDHTWLIGDVTVRDDSGASVKLTLLVQNFSVVTFIGGIDYDITDSSRIQKDIGEFKRFFLDQVRRKNMYEMAGAV